MRRALGVIGRTVLLVLGGILVLAGAAASILIGPDDTAQTGPHDLGTDGVAVLTEPKVLGYVGPVLHLTVANADRSEVFVGIAHEVDAESYVADSARLVVTQISRVMRTGGRGMPRSSQIAFSSRICPASRLIGWRCGAIMMPIPCWAAKRMLSGVRAAIQVGGHGC